MRSAWNRAVYPSDLAGFCNDSFIMKSEQREIRRRIHEFFQQNESNFRKDYQFVSVHDDSKKFVIVNLGEYETNVEKKLNVTTKK